MWYMVPYMRPSDGNIYEFRCLDDGLHVITLEQGSNRSSAVMTSNSMGYAGPHTEPSTLAIFTQIIV